jgi:hypothetical protein
MMRRVLSYHQVMPSFLDFLFVFGVRADQDVEVRFSGFRTEIISQDSFEGYTLPSLGRTDFRYQVCYNIRTAAAFVCHPVTHKWSWSIRQAAIHHQFDMGNGNQLWIVGDPHRTLTPLIDTQYPAAANDHERFGTFAASFFTTLEVHLVHIYWGIAEWRRVIQLLEDTLRTHVCTTANKSNNLTAQKKIGC